MLLRLVTINDTAIRGRERVMMYAQQMVRRSLPLVQGRLSPLPTCDIVKARCVRACFARRRRDA